MFHQSGAPFIHQRVPSSYFMGLLCLGRCLRMLFWLVLVGHPESGETLLVFVLPDCLHTVVMGNYLYCWLNKVRREATDLFAGAVMNV